MGGRPLGSNRVNFSSDSLVLGGMLKEGDHEPVRGPYRVGLHCPQIRSDHFGMNAVILSCCMVLVSEAEFN